MMVIVPEKNPYVAIESAEVCYVVMTAVNVELTYSIYCTKRGANITSERRNWISKCWEHNYIKSFTTKANVWRSIVHLKC